MELPSERVSPPSEQMSREGDIPSSLPEEILCMIFGYVSCYMSVAGSVCRKWKRLQTEFETKPFLLLAYIYKDEVSWLKEQWSLPDKVADLSASSVEKMVDSIMEESNPNTLRWMIETFYGKRALFIRAVEKRNYNVLNWMKEQGMIDSEDYLTDLIETFRPLTPTKFYMGPACCGKEQKEILSWYVFSKLPFDGKKVLACFNNGATFKSYSTPHWKLKLN